MGFEVAFALAGLGGFNAHGAGFLTAATESGVRPDLVTATSGQIIVLAEWLRGNDLKALLIAPEEQGGLFGTMRIALQGMPGVFRPARMETIRRWFKLPSPTDSVLDVFADRFLPAQQYVPLRSDEYLQAIVTLFNGSDIGIVFNAYSLRTGKAVLFGNNAARKMWPKQSKLKDSSPGRDVHNSRENRESVLHKIDIESLKAALWLSLYGFETLPNGLMDGAYHRACIISELHKFANIFAVRPLANGWVGAEPGNWFEVQDWQAEMWFSNGYKAEVEGMKRINDLIADKKLTANDFAYVNLVEIEPKTPAGYFNYFNERASVFDEARQLGLDALAAIKPASA
jgi:hypothetical protein